MSNKKISQLPSVSSVTGTIQFPTNDGGTTKKMTLAQFIAAYATATAAANKIPIADAFGKLDTWITPGSAGTVSIVKTTDFTILDDDVARNYVCNPNTSDQYGLLTGALPTGADNGNKIYRFIFGSAGNAVGGLVKILAEGTEKINFDGQQVSYVYLYSKGDYLELLWNGVDWSILKCKSSLRVGLVNRAVHHKIHIGNGVTYDNKSAAKDLTGYTFTEATSGNTGVVIEDTGGVGDAGILYFSTVTGTGIFTNDRVLTFSDGTTADVNGSSKNVDYNLYHGMGVNIYNINSVRGFYSTTATWTGAQEFSIIASGILNANITGANAYQVDTNFLQIQSGNSGFSLIHTDGSLIALYEQDVYIGIDLKFII